MSGLELQKTELSDSSANYLKELEHIESVNLYGTNVTDSCLSVIGDIPQLKRAYLWNSKLSPDSTRALGKENPDLEVEIGVWLK